jgi:hypothetical protein
MTNHDLLSPDAKPLHKQIVESGEDGMDVLCPVRSTRACHLFSHHLFVSTFYYVM